MSNNFSNTLTSSAIRWENLQFRDRKMKYDKIITRD